MENLDRVDDQKQWLLDARGCLGADEKARDLAAATDALLAAAKWDTTVFQRLAEQYRRAFGEADRGEAEHALGNLVLLDAGTNRSYRNAIFPVKRKRILALDQAGEFVPPGTRNVFLKYYSQPVRNMFVWEPTDSEAYFEAMLTTLTEFFCPAEKGGAI
jgi:hypothetical protein